MDAIQRRKDDGRKPTVLLILHRLTPHHMNMLEEFFNVITFEKFNTDRSQHGKEVVAIIYSPLMEPVTSKLLAHMPNLKTLCCKASGTEALDFDLFRKCAVTWSALPSVSSESCADMAFALMLAMSRKVVEASARSKRPESMKQDLYTFLGEDVSGTTLGIMGMGSIGSKIAEKAKAFRMKVLYNNRRKRLDEDDAKLGAVYYQNLLDMLPLVDFLVITCPLTSETEGAIGAREFELMKPSSTLINIASGSIVDTDALVTALQTGTIRAAALDVTNPEPLPKDHPLLNMGNVLVTPHIASATRGTRDKMIQMCIDNVIAGLEGRISPDDGSRR